MTIIAARRLLTPEGLQDDGWVEITGPAVTACGVGYPPAEPDATYPIVSPGFVDVHSHGGGGVSFTDGAEAARTVLATHRARGTTTMLASLVTGSLDAMEAAVKALTPLVDTGELAGIHLEGPWLAEAYKGAHEASLLRDPELADVQRLVGGRPVRMVTIAPERPGGLDAIAWLTSKGVVASVGHTAADDACARAAVAFGARGATHLFNAMPELLHRAPGPALIFWRAPDVWVELVFDGVHVATDLLAQVMKTKPDRCVLITDAMAAAGAGDGKYRLGNLDVEVKNGVARLAGTKTIAGSTLTLDRAVRTAVEAGVPLQLALEAATCHPADYLGLPRVGSLAAGKYADIVALDENLRVVKVMRRGVWV